MFGSLLLTFSLSLHRHPIYIPSVFVLFYSGENKHTVITNCTLITQNRSPFFQSQLTRQVAFLTTTVFFYHSSILTVKYRLCLTKYWSNRINFLRVVSYANIKGSVGFILSKVSVMRISMSLDLSSRSFIPLPCFIRSRRPLPLLAPSLVFPPRCSVKRHMRGVYLRVLSDFLTPHSFSVTFLTLSLRPFLFYSK